MKFLGIDYGRKKIGLALASTQLAEAYKVIRFNDLEEAIIIIKKVIEEENVEKVVMGLSEGKMALEIKNFSKDLQKEINLPIVFQDETLSTQEAQRLSIESGMKRKKRKLLEDAFTAAIILQDYLDVQEKS